VRAQEAAPSTLQRSWCGKSEVRCAPSHIAAGPRAHTLALGAGQGRPVRAGEQAMAKTFTRSAATIAMALLAAGGTTPARSQTVAELFSYKAPSGMFFEGTAKAEHYRFFYEDEERMANRRAGRGFVLSTPPSAEGRQAAHLRAGDRTPRWTNLSRP
jgi:hypothetical protein